MLFGGLAYLYPLKLVERYKRLTECIGILLILMSYAFITSSNAWPGYLALLPVLGSYLIIQACRTNSLLTGNVAFQYLGKWSYSIYLWHWPIVVAISYFKLGFGYTLLGLVLTIILGCLSYRFVESFKLSSALHSTFDLLNKRITYLALIPLLATSFIYSNTNLVFGLPETIFKNTLVNKDTESNGVYTWELHKSLNGNEFANDGRKKVLVIGDSQAGDFINMLSLTENFEETDLVSRIIYSRCRGVYLNSPSLDKMLSSLSKELSEKQVAECKTALTSLQTDESIRKANTIVLAMHWHNDFITYLLDSIKQIRELNQKVNILVVSGKSFSMEVPLMLFHSYESEKHLSSIAYEHIPNSSDYNYEIQHKQLLAKQSTLGYDYINLFDFFCYQRQCEVADHDSNVYFYDKNHLTRLGVKMLGEKLNQSKFINHLVIKS